MSDYVAHTEHYRGRIIELVHDQDASDPYREYDGMMPMMVDGGRDYGSHDYLDASSIIFDAMDALPLKKLKEVANVIDENLLEHAVKYAIKYCPPEHRKEAIIRQIQDSIREDVAGYHGRDFNLGKMEDIALLSGLHILPYRSVGYSQGDVCQTLVVLTPEMAKEWVADEDEEKLRKAMKSNAETWSAWAWGDVYGYRITGAEEDVENSCWGYYLYHQNGYEEVMAEARAVIDATITRTLNRHNKRIKKWIKGKVPLIYRKPFNHTEPWKSRRRKRKQ